MRTLLAGVAAALSMLSCDAFAADDCNGPDVSQMTLNACAWQRWQRHDRELNAAYAVMSKQETGADLDKLKAAQRAWVQYRNLECAYEATSADGGSLEPQTIADCQDTLTLQRLADFKRLTH